MVLWARLVVAAVQVCVHVWSGVWWSVSYVFSVNPVLCGSYECPPSAWTVYLALLSSMWCSSQPLSSVTLRAGRLRFVTVATVV